MTFQRHYRTRLNGRESSWGCGKKKKLKEAISLNSSVALKSQKPYLCHGKSKNYSLDLLDF